MKGVLNGIVEEVWISSELSHSPCVLVLGDVGTSGVLKPGWIMKVNPKHSIMTELKKKAESDQSCNIKNLIWLLFDISWLTSRCSNFEDLTHVAGGMHRVAKRELRIFRDGATACPDVEWMSEEHSDTTPSEGLGGEYNKAAEGTATTAEAKAQAKAKPWPQVYKSPEARARDERLAANFSMYEDKTDACERL